MESSICPSLIQHLKVFSATMFVVKIDWWNQLNEKSLTRLLWVKVDRSTNEKFKQIIEAKSCPYGRMIETIKCTSHNGKYIKREREIRTEQNR